MTGDYVWTRDLKAESSYAGRPVMGVLGIDCLKHYCALWRSHRWLAVVGFVACLAWAVWAALPGYVKTVARAVAEGVDEARKGKS